jgi:hypothetical protein
VVKLGCRDIIRLRKNQAVPNIYDVEMCGVDRLQGYDIVECHIVLYPYSRRVTSEDFAFYPFEEYVRDVASQQRSAYTPIHSQFNEVFGLSLGVLIAAVFALFKPQDLLSIESIVSVFGAYAIGKELWDDIDRALVNLSKKWRLRLQDSYYRYQLEKHTTLTSYSCLAKRRRYGKSPLLPVKIDFIKQSNSQTLRMCFRVQDITPVEGPKAHVHSIHIDPERLADLEQGGFLFGVKLSLNKGFLGINRNLELFQSLDKDSIGCLNEVGGWVEGAVFYRHTLTLGRIKFYIDQGLVHGERILQAEPAPETREASPELYRTSPAPQARPQVAGGG